MIRHIAGLALAAALLGVFPATSTAAKGFAYGVTAAEITDDSAILWARAKKAGRYRFLISPNSNLGGADTDFVEATKSHDLAMSVKVRDLDPATGYYYRFVGTDGGNARSDTGRFVTAPPPSARTPIEFAYSGDADGTPNPLTSKPFYNLFEVYRQMAREDNDFNVNLGDTIYSDTEIAGVTEIARTVSEKWAKYKQNLDLKNLRRVRADTGMYNHWDDHEFINDFSIPEDGRTIYKAGVRAFRDYMPVTYSSRRGIYRRFRWGRHAELFFPDARSFRDAKADSACINPDTGQPDLAPTAPPATRNLFSVIVPSLRQPVSQTCLSRIRDKEREYLGERQVERLLEDVRDSNATWKLIMNELPIQQFYALPYDRWEGYAAERTRLLRELAKEKNVVFLSTDVHANLVNDARFQTLEPGGPRNSGLLDVSTGPVATRSLGRQINDISGNPSAGELVADAFFKPQPPNGVGMKCAAVDDFSYAQVQVTSSRVTITPRDLNGKAVPDANDSRCGPFVVKKR